MYKYATVYCALKHSQGSNYKTSFIWKVEFAVSQDFNSPCMYNESISIRSFHAYIKQS